MCSSSDSRMRSNISRDTKSASRSQSAIAAFRSTWAARSSLQIAFQDLRHALADDQQLAQVLQIRQSLEEQDTLDQSVGMLHLVDGFAVFVLPQALQPPIAKHARVQEVLVDRGEFVFQHRVQVLHYLDIALHAWLPLPTGRYPTCDRPMTDSLAPRGDRGSAACSQGNSGPNGPGSRVQAATAVEPPALACWQSRITSRAQSSHRPQQPPTGNFICTSPRVRAPCSTARRIWRSVMP